MKRILLGLLCAVFGSVAIANTCSIRTAGAADQSVTVRFIDNTTGLPVAGLAYNSSGIDLTYKRDQAAAVAITEATQTAAGAHSDGGFVSTGLGDYRLDLPDAAFAAGVPEVVINGVITGYTMLPCTVALSPVANVVSFGGTAGTFSSGRPEVNTTHAAGTAWASGAITAASIATDAITAAKIAADAIGASELATDAIGAAEIAADAIGASELATGAITTAEFASGAINAAAIASDAITAAKVASDVSTEFSAAVFTVNATQISGDSGAADALETAFDGTAGSVIPLGILDQGTAQSVTATTVVLRSAAAFGDDTLLGATIVVCGSTQGYCQSGLITDYVNSTDTATVATWGVTPSGTSTYYVFGSAPSSGGGGGASAADVWAYATRTLTALDEDSTTIDLNASYVGGVTVFDEDLTTIDINATTIGTVTTATTATNLTNLPAITAGWLTATGIASDAFTAAKFASDVTTEIQSGLATAAELAKVPKSDSTVTWNATALASINTQADLALSDYDPPTKAELDAAQANVSVDEIQATALADLFNTNSATTYASAVSGSVVKEIADNAGGASLTVADIVDGVWDEAMASHAVSGSTGEALSAAGGAGDPWITTLPGSYTGSQAGKILADILVDTGTTLQGEIDGVQADTEDLQSRVPAALVGGRIDATVDGTGMEAGAVTAIQSGLATSASIAALNNLSSAQAQTAAAAALTAYDPPTRTEATSDKDAIITAIDLLNDLTGANIRDIVIEDQGSGVTLGCAISIVLAYAAGDLATSGSNSTYEDPSGTETRITGTVASAGNRTASVTCPSY